MIVRNSSEPETVALAVADHQRNVSDCNDGMQSCDRSKLTPSEAARCPRRSTSAISPTARTEWELVIAPN